MSVETWLILTAAALVIVVGPTVVGLTGVVRMRHGARQNASRTMPRRSWRPTILSALLFILAFNVTFFLQELFLVLPKALTPGLRPTLFHNNHSWDGDNPLAALFQGTGAPATLIMGLLCLGLWRRMRGCPIATRLLLFWMAYCGCLMALPQVAMGAINSASDVGMAMTYLQWNAGVRVGAGLAALIALVMIALHLTHDVLELAEADQLRDASARTRFVFRMVTLPALIGMLLVLPFRVPRELIEIVIVPLLVVVPGVAWIQASAWRARDARAGGGTITTSSIAYALAAVLLLLLIFQFVLRPGIRFY